MNAATALMAVVKNRIIEIGVSSNMDYRYYYTVNLHSSGLVMNFASQSANFFLDSNSKISQELKSYPYRQNFFLTSFVNGSIEIDKG
jgi:hypothetical protein